MNRMVGRVAIVTGADHPLGAACVARLCAEGAEVVAAGSNPVKGAAATCRHDGTTPDSWRALIAEARQRGGPAVLVNADLRFFAKPFTDTSLEEVQSLSASGVVAPWLGMKEVIPAIRARGGGYVVNVISVLGRVAHSDAAIFSALSGGLRVATKSAALECARQEPRVIVNAVIVGAVPLPTAVGTQGTMEDLSVGPAIDPSDVAAAVAQLACDESDYVTGMEIYVDGGYSVTSAR